MAKKKSKKYKEFKKRIKETNKNNAFMKAHYESQQSGSDEYLPRFSEAQQIRTGIYERGY